MNVLDLIKAHITEDQLNKAAAFINEPISNTVKGFDVACPAVLASILNATSNQDKMLVIWDLIQHKDNDIDLLNRLQPLFEGNAKESSYSGIGTSLLQELYGGQPVILHEINHAAGFQNGSSAGKVLSITASFILACLKNKAQNSELGLAALLKWIHESKEEILNTLPVGWASQLGLIHLMYGEHQSEDTEQKEDSKPGSWWWLWLLGVILAILGLWTCVKSCHDSEITAKINETIRKASMALDSASNKAAQATKEKIDSVRQDLNATWNKFGNFVNVRIGEYIVSLPDKGIELKWVQWLQDKASKVDKTTWFNFDRILFETGSSSLKNESQQQIDNIATIMKIMQSVEIKIGGYTDNTGDTDANYKLSLARAEAVKKALVEAGIDAKRMEAEGYGPEHPFSDNNTEAGKEQNRRVAIRVTKK